MFSGTQDLESLPPYCPEGPKTALVQSDDPVRTDVSSKLDQGGIRKIHRRIRVLFHKRNGGQKLLGLSEFKHLNCGSLNKFRQEAGAPRVSLKQMHSFCDYRAGAAESTSEGADDIGNVLMVGIVTVQICDQRAGIDQYGPQRQFCFLKCLPHASFGFINLMAPLR